jgi:hypothetical protein
VPSGSTRVVSVVTDRFRHGGGRARAARRRWGAGQRTVSA